MKTAWSRRATTWGIFICLVCVISMKAEGGDDKNSIISSEPTPTPKDKQSGTSEDAERQDNPLVVTKNKTSLTVICRDAWGAGTPIHPYIRHTIRKLTIHHQGVLFTDNRLAPRRLKTMQRYHQSVQKNFADIAYHFIIDREGNIYEGRPNWAAGETETNYDPTGHLLVCLLGNYEEQIPADIQLQSLVNILAWSSLEFNVPTSSIEGHRDHASTLCPGKNLSALIAPVIRARVEALLSKTTVGIELLCGEQGGTRLGEIAAGRK